MKDYTSDKNEWELTRLKSNLEAVRQTRFRYEELSSKYFMEKAYYVELQQRISAKKIIYLSLYFELTDSWVKDFNNDVKEVYFELKKAYKENADYLTELHGMLADKINLGEFQDKPVSTVDKLDFLDYFITKPKKADQLKEYLKTLKGKRMACAIYIIDQKGGNIKNNRKRFINTFNTEITMQGINSYFDNTPKGYELNFDKKEIDRDFLMVENQINKFF